MTNPLSSSQASTLASAGIVTPADPDTIKRSSVATDSQAHDDDTYRTRFSLTGTNYISLSDVEPVDIQIRDLAVTLDTSPSLMSPVTYRGILRRKLCPPKGPPPALPPTTKTLLSSISASLQPGTLTAIIGGSGSGKTTLLNTLSARLGTSSRITTTGTVTFNTNPSINSCKSAYVTQQDVLLPTLTVHETLGYAASLRLPPPYTTEQRQQIVDEVILELGLKDCTSTRVGDGHLRKGASGGERRRTSIGVQLLANPSVLFLDEPTTGLDATSAYQLVKTLKKLATRGRTVVMTLHAPRSEIWGLFDNLVVLSKGGEAVYAGEREGSLSWFEGQMSRGMGKFVNPAEWVVDLAAVDVRSGEAETESLQRVERLRAAWREESSRLYGSPAPGGTGLCDPRITGDLEKGSRWGTMGRAKATRGGVGKTKDVKMHAGFWQQLSVLTHRTFKVTYRDPMGLSSSLLEAILMGIVTGYIFFSLPRDLSGIRSRQGALYTAAGLQGYLFLIFETYRLTLDIPTFDRERSEGCASALPFMLSRRLARLVTEDVPVPFLFSLIFYYMAGFDREDTGKFFTFFAVVLLNHYIAVACAMTCVATARNFAGASLIGNLVYTLQSMACGYFIQSETIPVYVRWLKWITYTFYVFGALCTNEFRGSFYDCPADPSDPSNPACIEYTGAFILNALGFPDNWLWRLNVVLAAFVFLFLLLSYLGLTFWTVNLSIARAHPSSPNDDTSSDDHPADKENTKSTGIAEVRRIDVGLDKFSLLLESHSPLAPLIFWDKTKQSVERKQILHPTSATFQAGEINVIMGPSGSGKTSLLNAMADRLCPTTKTRYKRSGEVSFNGAIPSLSVINSVVSFVPQHDDALLLPSLTVRETLRYAALLRLSPHLTRREKTARADSVLMKMGLKDCADTLIGNMLVKGISGGEKRRVTIGIQILTDPHILLLDEPTSGLDAFTARSIMELLQGLAGEGRTVVLTIHQARSDLWGMFGNVLLLARGGREVYSGRREGMVAWFEERGEVCAERVNPADFALDVITVDLRGEGVEELSRRRVDGLVEAWERCVREETGPLQLQGKQGGVRTGGGGGGKLEDIEEEKTAVRATTAFDDKITHAEEGADLTLRPAPSHIPPPRHSLSHPLVSTPAELGALARAPTPFPTALPVLLSRATLNLRRQPPLLLARTMQVLGLGIILTLFFAPLSTGYESVQNRMGFIQEVGAFYFVGMLQNVAVYPGEREVAYSEYADGIYSPSIFLMVYTILEVPFEILSSAIFGLLTVFAVGVNGDGSPEGTAMMFGYLTACCFAIVSCGESLGILFNTLFPTHTGFAVTLAGVVLSVANTMQGVMSIDMPAVFEGANWLSPLRYAARALAPVSLRGVVFGCTEEQIVLRDGGEMRCPIETGEEVLELYDLNADEVVQIAGLMGVVVAYRLFAWLVLATVKGRWWKRDRYMGLL